MFQPQATPYNPFFSSYGVGHGLDDYSFPPTPLSALQGGGGSPSLLQSQHSPASTSSSAATHFNPGTTRLPYDAPSAVKMEPDNQAFEDDIAAQEAAAREYQPDLRVRGSTSGEILPSVVLLGGELLTVCVRARLVGSSGRRKDLERGRHRGVRQGRPRLYRKDDCGWRRDPAWLSPRAC